MEPKELAASAVVPGADPPAPRPPSHALGPFGVMGVKGAPQKEKKADVGSVAAAIFGGKGRPGGSPDRGDAAKRAAGPAGGGNAAGKNEPAGGGAGGGSKVWRFGAEKSKRQSTCHLGRYTSRQTMVKRLHRSVNAVFVVRGVPPLANLEHPPRSSSALRFALLSTVCPGFEPSSVHARDGSSGDGSILPFLGPRSTVAAGGGVAVPSVRHANPARAAEGPWCGDEDGDKRPAA